MAETWKTVAYLEDVTSINHGGSGQTTAQLAINALSAVSGGTNEHVLTKDTATGNAKWKAAVGGGSGGGYYLATPEKVIDDDTAPGYATYEEIDLRALSSAFDDTVPAGTRAMVTLRLTSHVIAAYSFRAADDTLKYGYAAGSVAYGGGPVCAVCWDAASGYAGMVTVMTSTAGKIDWAGSAGGKLTAYIVAFQLLTEV